MSNPQLKQPWVLASNNAGKIKEFNQKLSPFQVSLAPQAAFGVESVEETGISFLENALLKARHAAFKTGLPALADDSGICVQALNRAPGVYSARFAGIQATDEENNQKLLESLAGVPDQQRDAFYVCVLAFVLHPEDPMPLIVQASWHGCILQVPQGQGGFGYDPLFYLPALGMTAAQLPLEQKNQISHRGQAVTELIASLQKMQLIAMDSLDA